ncbi:uncharacterized protein LOC111127938 [Crassostrea virginica]
MEHLVLFAYVVSLLIIPAETSCWIESGDGSQCEYKGNVLEPGQTYEQTTGPSCVKCTCYDGAVLSCCYTGKKATSYPDTCKIVTKGCDEIAVKKNNENETCDEEVSYVG